MTKHLWESDHPYYIPLDCPSMFPKWGAFVEKFRDADMDYNWFVRWDWYEGENWGAIDYNGDDYYRNGRFLLQCIGQRKALLRSFEISVCRADEPAVIEFLKPRWDYMQKMWAPLS